MNFGSLSGLSAFCLLTALSSCGDGTSGSGGDQVAVPSTPTPLPTPTPTPSPATTFSMVAAGPLAGALVIDNNNDDNFGDSGRSRRRTDVSDRARLS